MEVTNRSLLQNLQKNIEECKTLWAEELPNVLWDYRTDSRKPARESPFWLNYSTEALLRVEVGDPFLRLQHFDPQVNLLGIRTNLELLEERRDNAVIRMAAYKQANAKYFGKISPCQFQVGDQVLRSSAA